LDERVGVGMMEREWRTAVGRHPSTLVCLNVKGAIVLSRTCCPIMKIIIERASLEIFIGKNKTD